jgi:hypothetical protein
MRIRFWRHEERNNDFVLWADRERSAGRNPVHSYFWPECKRPLPHGHHAFDLSATQPEEDKG